MPPIGTWVPSDPGGFGAFGGVFPTEGLRGLFTFKDSLSGGMSLAGEVEGMS
jgi:hypothetical protein